MSSSQIFLTRTTQFNGDSRFVIRSIQTQMANPAIPLDFRQMYLNLSQPTFQIHLHRALRDRGSPSFLRHRRRLPHNLSPRLARAPPHIIRSRRGVSGGCRKPARPFFLLFLHCNNVGVFDCRHCKDPERESSCNGSVRPKPWIPTERKDSHQQIWFDLGSDFGTIISNRVRRRSKCGGCPLFQRLCWVSVAMCRLKTELQRGKRRGEIWETIFALHYAEYHWASSFSLFFTNFFSLKRKSRKRDHPNHCSREKRNLKRQKLHHILCTKERKIHGAFPFPNHTKTWMPNAYQITVPTKSTILLV